MFAGAGGGILAGVLLGHRPVCAVEIEPYCRELLLEKQKNKILPKFPIWDDIRTFDGRPWKGKAEILCGGFPCQDISNSGQSTKNQKKGIQGQKSSLWKEYARIIREIEPKIIFAENSSLLRIRGLGVVLKDLAEMGFDARWCMLGARHIGAIHKRERMWILAYPSSWRLQGGGEKFEIRSTDDHIQNMVRWRGLPNSIPKPYGIGSRYEVANFMDRVKSIGNGQVPQVAAIAFSILSEGIVLA